MALTQEVRKLACDLVAKAYEHHKTHARFQETQRAWMVTAYFTLTALVYVGLAASWTSPESASILRGMVIVHFFASVLFMISAAKVSGEFRRHFTRGEKILRDVREACKQDPELTPILANIILETAAIREGWSGKRFCIVLFSNAAVHAYMFSLVSACDVYLFLVGFSSLSTFSPCATALAGLWFLLSATAQHYYINKLEETGTN